MADPVGNGTRSTGTVRDETQHIVVVPNSMDGVPDVTQKPIQPGATFTYEFRALPTAKSSNVCSWRDESGPRAVMRGA